MFVNYLRCSEVRYSNGIEDQVETLEEQEKKIHMNAKELSLLGGWTKRGREGEMRESHRGRGGEREREREREIEREGGRGRDDNHQ